MPIFSVRKISEQSGAPYRMPVASVTDNHSMDKPQGAARELDALQPQLLKPSQPMMPNTSSQMAACLNMTSSSLV